MTTRLRFAEEEMVIDEGLGYPKVYAKLCRDPNFNPYRHGPPFTFIPYVLNSQEVSRVEDLDQMFPIIDLEAKPSTKPKIFASLLWKQLNHLGSAGFDPAKFRVDPYGNVLYYHADSASPLAWEIDHWFPCSRGGLTVPSNLRVLQRQVCKKKHNSLEFLVPWWDLQLGISVNQFLSIFASSNSDFRNRSFSLLFSEGENEELNASQTVDSHAFPQHFNETKLKVGLAPAAVVLSRRDSSGASLVLRSVDPNRGLRPNSPATASRKFLVDNDESLSKSIQIFRSNTLKENDNPEMGNNPYLTIAMARDSLRQKEEMKAEIRKLDDELDDLKQKNDVERVSLQDLESVLIKRRRRAEKCRRLAEAQSSYRTLLEKMIRDAMHQSVIYKEQVRLNQAATSALTARLEAQKAICDSSEKELHRRFKHRDELEKQIRPHWEHARKRSRTDDTLLGEKDDKPVLYLPDITPRKPQGKELRVFLEEEQKASEAGLSLREQEEKEDEEKEQANNILAEKTDEYNTSLIVVEDETPIEDVLKKLEIEEEGMKKKSVVGSVLQSPEREEDEEYRKQRGKGNVEKWLQMLLEDTKEGISMDLPHQNTNEDEKNKTDEIIKKLNLKNPQKEIKILKFPGPEEKTGLKSVGELIEPQVVQARDHKGKEQVVEMEVVSKMAFEKSNTNEMFNASKRVGSSKRFEGKERKERSGKERELVRCESARAFRPVPYSPTVILGMRKGVDCIGKKPIVIGSDEDGDEDRAVGNNFIKSSIKTIKKVVKI